MIPFRFQFVPGVPISEQVAYAARRAIISGQMAAGDAFPSVRALSRALKINPNTAHKVIAQLLAEGLLESRPGIGTVVAEPPDSTRRERAQLLGPQIEGLVVEAKRLGVLEEDVLAAVTQHWARLTR